VTVPVAIAVVLVCILLEGFFSGSEMAIVNADRLKLKTAADSGSSGAARALKMLEKPEFTVGTCLIGTNLCTVTASTAATAAFVAAWPEAGEAAAVALLIPLILLGGELVPKSVYQHYADRLTPVVVYPLSAFSTLFWPVLVVVEGLSTLLQRVTGTEGSVHRAVNREDLIQLLDESEQVHMDEDDRELIQRVFEFTEARVHEVMKPLIDVIMVSDQVSARAAAERMLECGHSRIPVFQGRVDRIVGIVDHHELLHVDDLDVPVTRIARPVLFVPESKRVEGLFREFQRSSSRVAIPVDEYGGAVGLITMEDILEEIVGDIEDEADRRESDVRRIGERQWLCNARIEAEPLEEATDFEMPEGEFETLAGFMLWRLGRVPKVGERVLSEGWLLEVTRASDRAILEIRLQRLGPSRGR
jgi:putative hemolysin